MQYISLHGTELRVSRIALGTWAMGGDLWGGTDEQDAIRTIHAAIDRGINLIDTAPIYGLGLAETLVGKALATCPRGQDVLVATKVGLAWTDQGAKRNASRHQILQEVAASRQRLKRDHIDIYQVHWPDPLTPVSETAEVMWELLEKGWVRALGVSNFSVSQMRVFQRSAPLHTAQPPYNLFEREAEKSILPFCHENQITTLTYGALCRGLLGGQHRDKTFAPQDIRRLDPKFQPDRLPQYLAAVHNLDAFAKGFGKSVLQLALRWILDQKGADVALWGARHPRQLEPLEGVFDWSLNASQRNEVNDIVATHVKESLGPEFMAPPLETKSP